MASNGRPDRCLGNFPPSSSSASSSCHHLQPSSSSLSPSLSLLFHLVLARYSHPLLRDTSLYLRLFRAIAITTRLIPLSSASAPGRRGLHPTSAGYHPLASPLALFYRSNTPN